MDGEVKQGYKVQKKLYGRACSPSPRTISTNRASQRSAMDDLLALLDEDAESLVEEQEERAADQGRGGRQPDQHQQRPQSVSATTRRVTSATSSKHLRSKLQDAPQLSAAEKLALSVDDRIGIRMINRKMAGIDLMNLMSDYPYQSTATLSASSLANLNRLLADPASVVDAATVCGRTNLATIGLVFSNSGTRVAASGNAFCVLQIGNFRTGPTVSVLLFGSSYSKYCRNCGAGKVVALINPRLLPAKTGGKDSTAISFSVNDEQQIIMVGDARDFGYCKGTVRGKNEQGVWVSNAKQCCHYVDKRVGLYCPQHRQQERNKAAPARGGMAAVGALQQLRQQATEFSRLQGHPNRTTTLGKQLPPNNQQQQPQRGGFETTRQMLERQIPKGISQPSNGQKCNISNRANEKKSTATNSILNPPRCGCCC